MALGRPVASCAVRILVGFGKGKRLRGSPLRRSIDSAQARAAINAAASSYFPSYTTSPTRGVFLRDGEPGLALDFYRTQYDPPGCTGLINKARCLASDLRATLRQHSVMVVAFDPASKKPLTADIVTRGAAKSCSRKLSKAARRAANAAAARTV